MSDLSVLCPAPQTKEEKMLYNSVGAIVRKIVVNAVIHRPGSNVLAEVYFAGLWHGAKLSGPAPRKPDYLELAPQPKRRGRPRKGTP